MAPRTGPGKEGAAGARAICLHVVSFSSDMLGSNSCWQGEQSPQHHSRGQQLEGRGRGRGRSCDGAGRRGMGAYAMTLGAAGDAGRRLPLPLLRDLAPAWLHQVAQGNPCQPQGNQCQGAWRGGRQQGVHEGPGQTKVHWRQIPLFGVFLPTPCHPGAGGAQGPSSHSHPAGSHVVLE